MRLKSEERPELGPVSHEPEITIHPSADVLPMMAGEEWEDFKAAILEAGGNLEPVVLHDRQLLDGRNRFRAVQELRAAGHDVELRQKDWQDSGSEGVTAFIVRVNLHRRHLTDEQRVAIALKLQPQIQIEAAERQAAAQIQPGECRNPHGRRGKPDKAETQSTPPSEEERRERNRRKEARSTAGKVAKAAGVSTHEAKKVIRDGIAPDLEQEVFSVLKPVMGAGANAQYLESRGDQQLDEYFEQKDRLRMKGAGSYPNKEDNMAQTWADTVTDEDGDRASSLAPLEPLLVDEEQAGMLLGVSRRKIFELNKQGIVPCRMVGSRKMYSVKRLREFAEGEVS